MASDLHSVYCRRLPRLERSMNRMTFRSLIAVPVLFLSLSVPSIASAEGITWTLSGVTFDDGGTASGTFVYDALANTVGLVNIVTTAGVGLGAFPGATYTSVNPGFVPPTSLEIAFVTNPSLLDFTGTPALDLQFLTDLTNSGGTISLIGAGQGGGEVTCADAGCSAAGSVYRLINAGEVTSPAVPVPEPSAFLLLGLGVVVLVGITKR